MLTYDQSVFFLENVLRMPFTWRNLLVEKPLEFLTHYMKRHAVRVAFQNMHMASVEEGRRWFPSEEEIMNVGLSGIGGCCLHLNYFSKMVFQAIGLDSFVVRGDHYCAPVVGTHCMVMVKLHGTKFSGVYMIEVGGAFPMLEPIPMDKEKLPYRTLQAAGFPYEFREIAPGWIGKFHIGGGVLGGKFTDKKETLRTCWEMKPRALWEFDYPMLETFTKPCYSVLLRAPYMQRSFSNTEFQRLFPELPENEKGANQKGKVLVTKTNKIVKVFVPNKSNLGESKVIGGLMPTANGKKSVIMNGKLKNVIPTTKDKETNGKPSMDLTLSKLEKTESGDDEYVVVTEEEIESDNDDDFDDPKNFIFACKRRIVVADDRSRKLVKDYNSYVEMTDDLKKYFPKIPSEVVDKAIKTFSAYEPTEHFHTVF